MVHIATHVRTAARGRLHAGTCPHTTPASPGSSGREHGRAPAHPGSVACRRADHPGPGLETLPLSLEPRHRLIGDAAALVAAPVAEREAVAPLPSLAAE